MQEGEQLNWAFWPKKCFGGKTGLFLAAHFWDCLNRFLILYNNACPKIFGKSAPKPAQNQGRGKPVEILGIDCKKAVESI
jgi:hypothetical protein